MSAGRAQSTQDRTSRESAQPSGAPARRELSARGLILGVAITLVFTAANVYFGLKAGLTFATSIPAAVISMALLRGFKGSSIQENNIVQTVASAAGTLAAIIFVLPGLVMIGWWNGFPYWASFAIIALGGVLGVMYSIPLRRALVTHSDLPYPEGVACAEVLKVGALGRDGETPAEHAPDGGVSEVRVHAADDAAAGREGLRAIVVGSLTSALFAAVIATKIFAEDLAVYFRVGNKNAVSGVDMGLSFALLAVGHLIGLWAGMSMLLGVVIGWAGAIPYLTGLHATPGTPQEIATSVWRHQVRFIGAGVIAVAALWSLVKLVKPVVSGLSSALAASRTRRGGHGASLARTEQDIPIGWVAAITAICMLPIAGLLAAMAAGSGLQGSMTLLIVGGVLYIALISFLVAAVCGYMAGLIGASNSPVSGVGILVVVGAASLLEWLVAPSLPPSAAPALVAFALFITAVVFGAATISNDNLQDLKTGQLVDATPWRQQVALLVGVVAGAALIPLVLTLINQAYGFAGAPGAGAHALAAPQAALISALAQGILQGNLDWTLIGAGCAIGVAVIVLDEILVRCSKASLPPLAVGMGIYLPMSTTLTIIVGTVIGHVFEGRADRGARPAHTKQLGVLLASGMIVGESLIGIVIAAVVVLSGKEDPLSLVGPGYGTAAIWFGGAAFAASIYALYAWIAGPGRASP